MNNEEKILAMLTEMKVAQEELKASQEELKASQEEMKVTFEKRFSAVEGRLDELDARSLRTAVLLETEVARNVRLVYEGQEMLRQKMDELAPKERVEVLEDEIITLKSTVKMIVKRLEQLEKAE